jgi:uncharacterized protein (DUF952 family)
VSEPGLSASPARLRWLYHAAPRDAWERARAGSPSEYRPEHAHGAGASFIHASFRDVVLDSARLYVPSQGGRVIVQIDPRPLGPFVRVVETPRGPMPHIYGPVPSLAIARIFAEDEFARDAAHALDELETSIRMA